MKRSSGRDNNKFRSFQDDDASFMQMEERPEFAES